MDPRLSFRTLQSEDQKFLWDMFYIALWDAPDEPRRPRSVLEHPKMQRIVGDWGRNEDFGLVAVETHAHRDVGAIWTRLDGYDQLEGYGCDYPCLGIAVLQSEQNKGIGTYLLTKGIEELRQRTLGLRLGVHPLNTNALRLYTKLGFKEYAVGAGAYPQMKLEFVPNQSNKAPIVPFH